MPELGQGRMEFRVGFFGRDYAFPYPYATARGRTDVATRASAGAGRHSVIAGGGASDGNCGSLARLDMHEHGVPGASVGRGP